MGARARRSRLVLRPRARQPLARGRQGRQQRHLLPEHAPLRARVSPGRGDGRRRRRRRAAGRAAGRHGALRAPAPGDRGDVQPDPPARQLRSRGVQRERGERLARPGPSPRPGGDPAPAHAEPRAHGHRPRLPRRLRDPPEGGGGDGARPGGPRQRGAARGHAGRAGGAPLPAAGRGDLRALRHAAAAAGRWRRRGRSAAGRRGSRRPLRARARQAQEPVRDGSAGPAAAGRQPGRRAAGEAPGARAPAGAGGGGAAPPGPAEPGRCVGRKPVPAGAGRGDRGSGSSAPAPRPRDERPAARANRAGPAAGRRADEAVGDEGGGRRGVRGELGATAAGGGTPKAGAGPLRACPPRRGERDRAGR